MDADEKLYFQVKPRLLTLLGDQLIRDATLAVFELVKNSYDANATNCSVTIDMPASCADSRIIIKDNGVGMDESVLRNAWMTIATDYRALQRSLKKRTAPPFNRFPLGEKGLGRLSVHKLGHFVKLVTRMKGGDELVVEFDWDTLEKAKDFKDAGVRLSRRKPTTFPGKSHGTKLEVKKLRETWTRGDLRRLHRAVNGLCSPFKGPVDFKVTLSAPGREAWLDGLFTADMAYKSALYRVSGYFENACCFLEYEFIPPAELARALSPRRQALDFSLTSRDGRKSVPIDLGARKIGRVDFEFWIFDRDSSILRKVTDDIKGLKDYLDDNGGMRIYRDGIRVYDFGEPGNDWLNLDLRRVNSPTAKTSNNQILGALRLDATTSTDLREKSNREGFIENPAYADFRNAVISTLTQVEAEKVKDQKRIRQAIGKGTGQTVFAKLTELRDALKEKHVLESLEPKLKALEQELHIYRDQLLHAAVPGLTLGIMLHGAEKILDELREATRRRVDPHRVEELVDRLYRAMRPITNLLKNPAVSSVSARTLIKEALFSTELRLKRHKIKLISNITEQVEFKVQGSKQMLIASITNLIDNSIHWLDIKLPPQKLLYVGTTQELEGGPAIVVADNGPGFGNDAPEDLIAPFFTRRNGGMGLGLYIVNEVMRVNQGALAFPEPGEIQLPVELDGAVVAMQFLEYKK